MNLSSLSAADRRALITAAVVVIFGVLSISYDWGFGLTLGVLGGIAALAVLLLPQVSPATRLPASKGLSLLVAAAVAAAGFVISAVRWLSYVVDVTEFSNILFDVGLVASIVLLWFAWVAYQAEPKAATASSPPPMSDASEPPAGEG